MAFVEILLVIILSQIEAALLMVISKIFGKGEIGGRLRTLDIGEKYGLSNIGANVIQ